MKLNPRLTMVTSRLNLWLLIVIFVHLFLLYLLGQYDFEQLSNRLRSYVMVVISVLMSSFIIAFIFFFFPKYVFGRKVLIIHVVVVSVLLVFWRWIFNEIIMKNAIPKRLALIGNGQTISSFVEEIARIPDSGLSVKSVCLEDSVGAESCFLPSGPCLYVNVFDLLESHDCDVLAFDSTNVSFSDFIIRRILQIKSGGKAVYDLPALYKTLTGKVPLVFIDGRWLLNRDGFQGASNASYVRIKRIIDCFLSIVLLILSAPFFLLVGLCIKCESRGKIFYTQERLGIHKKPFKCLKFRTMVENAEKDCGPIWSRENDVRVTRVGRALRKTRLDELPQLWNILKGEMSFVGPRPIREHFAERLAEKIPFYELRFDVKPGLSGWAQVNYDYAGSEVGQLEKFQYELFYIENMSLVLDLLTILRTLRKIVQVEGT
jgi:exopolysaccharide biosynthesis polyprenyl glycosylphosphotransferase